MQLLGLIAYKKVLLSVVFFFLLRLVIYSEWILGMLVIMTLIAIANMAAMFCTKYDGNQALAVSTTFVSTPFSVIGIPIFMLLFFAG